VDKPLIEITGRHNGVPRLEPAPAATDRGGPRVALYSHDTQGLGHIRRNILISRALCADGASPVILLLSGVREATAFAMPSGVDCLTLPSLGKDLQGRYYPRSLGVPVEDLIKVRSGALAAALRSFDPDVLIVDKVPGGIFGELETALAWLRARGRTRVVLGLREILDGPDAVRREWEEGDYASSLRTYFDRVWVYGDRRVYDTAAEYDLPSDIAGMMSYSGYLNPLDVEPHRTASEPYVPEDPYDLCVIGGGQDGLPLAEAFLRAERPAAGVLVTGPLMPEKARASLHALAAGRNDVRVLEFVTNPCPLLASASRVIAMGGYNTMCEILAHGTPALIVPRTTPRTEQLIRARRFADLGLVDLLHPDQLSPDAITRWLGAPLATPVPAGSVLDFDGVSKLPGLLDELLVNGRKGPTYAIR
jgi:predicted glycosyltransferase